MDKLVSLVTSNPKVKNPRDDDFADRLSSRYTVAYLVVAAVLVSFRSYVGSPITCWAPVHFHSSHRKFTNSYCWVRNTYYLPWDEEVPRPNEERQMILYYQWIPFILLGQALFFYLPSIVWHGLNSKAGVDSDNILSSAHTMSRTDSQEKKERTLMLVTKQIDRFLESRKATQTGYHLDMKTILSATLCRCCGRRVGNYLVMLFLFSKICYIANVISQLFILNKILSAEFNLYGFDIMRDQVADHDWTEAKNVIFPRVTFCDFLVRRLGNNHRYTVQCVLPINLYNEKIYMILWFWMVFVAAASILSLIVWFVRTLLRGDRMKFIQNHLEAQNKLQMHGDYERCGEFLDNYLRQDGAFILRLVAHNTDSITTTEITCSLWDFWKEKVSKRKPMFRGDMPPDDDFGLGGADTLPMKTAE